MSRLACCQELPHAALRAHRLSACMCSCLGSMRVLPRAEFEDTPGACPNVSALAPRPSYLTPLLPDRDRWAWYNRTLTFQARVLCKA